MIDRMCPQCAEYGAWGEPGTAVGLFLQAMNGPGLLFELDRYAGPDEDTPTDEEMQKASALLNRAPSTHAGHSGPDEEDEDADWEAYQEACQVRDRVFALWRGAAASLHRSYQLLAPFPWLKPWAEPAVGHKTSFAALLHQRAAELVSPHALTAAAGAAAMDAPHLPAEEPVLALLGSPDAVARKLRSLWIQWRNRSGDSWDHPRQHNYLSYQLSHELSGRRKGRSEVRAVAQRLVASWTAAAENAGRSEAGERVLLAHVPGQRPAHPHEKSGQFCGTLTEWEWGVLATWAKNVDWQNMTATVRAPGTVASRLLMRTSALDCRPTEDPGGEPAGMPQQLVEPGVFDDRPIAERKPVTTAHLRAIRALLPDANELYVVLSAGSGPQVLDLSQLERKVNEGGTYVVVASASGLPRELLPPHEQLDDKDTERVWPERIHDSGHPDFGRSLGLAEGERVVRRMVGGFNGPHAADAALRSLALARAVDDLRELEGSRDATTGYRRSAFPSDVWHGLLAVEQLSLEPFEQDSDDHPSGWSGLPLGILAQAQLYSTDAFGQFEGRAHSPDCAHQRHDNNGVTRAYDLVTVAQMLHAHRFDPCSKCGGYATRRLTDTQVAYYRAAHQVHDFAHRVRRAVSNPGIAGDTAKLASQASKWNDLRFTDAWFVTRGEALQWQHAITRIHRQTQRLG
ncbi:hypothetical protein PV664_33995 [Streptomyces sp. ME01-18a]|uniref:hypothetical protein n=1 Tax=Streptomyces sp. ME01-18a TaxID=3028669 RepID=UPI0029B669BF|nr:hypothetical protein [Streptomyces sp. ME01-18a]MDX3433897.1 hypothetical protein [Streptomyces sp. ME01-18a]